MSEAFAKSAETLRAYLLGQPADAQNQAALAVLDRLASAVRDGVSATRANELVAAAGALGGRGASSAVLEVELLVRRWRKTVP